MEIVRGYEIGEEEEEEGGEDQLREVEEGGRGE